jgi:hypothetical protein
LTIVKNKVKHPKACFTIEYHLCHIDDQSIRYKLQSTILNDVNQFKLRLESDKGYFTLKVKIMTLMSQFILPAIVHILRPARDWKTLNCIKF